MDGRMKLSQLKAREIRVKRKAGYGVLYFCEKFSVKMVTNTVCFGIITMY